MASHSADTAHCGGPKRKRKSHAKVKTGCLTCKIRRKKCDEKYPACVRCTSTGRKCDGYASRLPSPAASGACKKRRKSSTPTQLPTPPSSDEVTFESLGGWSDDGIQRDATGFVIPMDKSDIDASVVQFSEVDDWSDLEMVTSHVTNTTPQTTTLGHSTTEYCPRDTTSEALQPTSLTIESPHRRWQPFPLQLHTIPFLKHFDSDREALCFDFFCARTGPEFSGFFDSSFWSGWLLQACTIHPAVRQAMTALGAVHRRQELGLTPEAFNYCELALRSYTKAIKGLNQGLRANDPHSLELSMVVSTLFAAYETFQYNYADATKHMAAGLKILFDRKLKRISTTSTRSWAKFDSNALLDFIDRLEILCDGFFDSLLIIPEISLEDEEPHFPCVPSQFSTLEEARDVLVALVHQVLPFLYHDQRDRATRLRQHQDYVAALFRWSCTYAEYFKQFKSSMSVSNSQAALLLRVYREAAYLVLLVDKTTSLADGLITRVEDPNLDCEFSCHNHQERREVIQGHFAKICSLADSLLERPSRSHIGCQPCTFSVDNRIVPPVYLAATKCHSTKVRHQATSLLWRTTHQQQEMDKLGVYGIAEKLSAMEESALSASGFLPAQTNTTSMDVTVFLEERRFLLRYCVPNQEDGSLTWTQDWVAF